MNTLKTIGKYLLVVGGLILPGFVTVAIFLILAKVIPIEDEFF